MPDPIRLLESKARMKEDACKLGSDEREVVEAQITETCRHRDWLLYAVSCRSNHTHVVVGAVNVTPKKIRVDLKAWCTRRLKERIDPNRENWWAERGSIRWIFNEESLENVLVYVTDAQDRKGGSLSQPEA